MRYAMLTAILAATVLGCGDDDDDDDDDGQSCEAMCAEYADERYEAALSECDGSDISPADCESRAAEIRKNLSLICRRENGCDDE